MVYIAINYGNCKPDLTIIKNDSWFKYCKLVYNINLDDLKQNWISKSVPNVTTPAVILKSPVKTLINKLILAVNSLPLKWQMHKLEKLFVR